MRGPTICRAEIARLSAGASIEPEPQSRTVVKPCSMSRTALRIAVITESAWFRVNRPTTFQSVLMEM